LHDGLGRLRWKGFEVGVNPVSEPSRPITLSAGGVALLCSALWGGTAVAIRVSVDDLPPVGLAGLRFTLGCAFMFMWCRVQGIALAVQPHQRKPILVASLLLFVQITLLNLGTEHTTASHSTIFINSHPMFVALLAHFALQGDALTRRKVAGLAVAMAGMCVVVLAPGLTGEAGAQAGLIDSNATPAGAVVHGPDASSVIGDLLVLGSGILLGVKTVYIKRVLAVIEPGKLLLWHELVAVILFFATSLVVEGTGRYHFTTPAVLGLLYQGLVVAGFCFAAWTTLLKRHRASQLAVFAFSTPLFGLTFSHVLRGDRISFGLVLGGAAVAAGIYLVTTSAGRGTGEEGTTDA